MEITEGQKGFCCFLATVSTWEAPILYPLPCSFSDGWRFPDYPDLPAYTNKSSREFRWYVLSVALFPCQAGDSLKDILYVAISEERKHCSVHIAWFPTPISYTTWKLFKPLLALCEWAVVGTWIQLSMALAAAASVGWIVPRHGSQSIITYKYTIGIHPMKSSSQGLVHSESEPSCLGVPDLTAAGKI